MGEALRMMGEIDRITEKFLVWTADPAGLLPAGLWPRMWCGGDAKESDCIFVLREEIRTMANMLESIGGFVPGNMHRDEKKEKSDR